eukprot:5767041-Amphidinium_carterae.2
MQLWTAEATVAAYVDSDWAGEPVTRRSTTGMLPISYYYEANTFYDEAQRPKQRLDSLVQSQSTMRLYQRSVHSARFAESPSSLAIATRDLFAHRLVERTSSSN